MKTSFTNYASGIWLSDCSILAVNWKNDFPTWSHRQIFFDIVLFLLSSLVTGPSFMSISLLVLELWQFSIIRDWPGFRKSETPSSVFCPISGDCGELGIPNLTWMSLIKCYWILLNSRVTAFAVSVKVNFL